MNGPTGWNIRIKDPSVTLRIQNTDRAQAVAYGLASVLAKALTTRVEVWHSGHFKGGVVSGELRVHNG